MKKEGLLPREELARLFPNLPELIEIHSEEPPARPLPWPDFRFLPTCQDPQAHSPCPYSLRGEPDAQPEASIPTPPTSEVAPRPCPHSTTLRALFPRHQGPGLAAQPQALLSSLLAPDSWCEAMRKLREEGPIIKEVSDLMLARVWLPRPQGGLGGRGGEVPGRGVRWALWCPFSLSVRRPRPGGAPAGGRTVLLLSVHRPGADQDQAAQGEPVPALHAGTRGLCLSPLKPASPVLTQSG